MSLEYRQQVGMEKSAQNSQEHGVGKRLQKNEKKVLTIIDLML